MSLIESEDARAEVREVRRLEVGDRVANVGRIDKLERVGVFIVCEVHRFTPSLATGELALRRGEVTFHESDDVWVVVES